MVKAAVVLFALWAGTIALLVLLASVTIGR
jgi:hypothetical protein